MQATDEGCVERGSWSGLGSYSLTPTCPGAARGDAPRWGNRVVELGKVDVKEAGGGAVLGGDRVSVPSCKGGPRAMKFRRSILVTTPATTDRVVCLPFWKHFCSATTNA